MKAVAGIFSITQDLFCQLRFLRKNTLKKFSLFFYDGKSPTQQGKFRGTPKNFSLSTLFRLTLLIFNSGKGYGMLFLSLWWCFHFTTGNKLFSVVLVTLEPVIVFIFWCHWLRLFHKIIGCSVFIITIW